MPTVVSVFGVQPLRIGGTETFARELSKQLGERDWQSVLCFETEPPTEVRKFLELPNVKLEVLGECTASTFRSLKNLRQVLLKYRPEILHFHFTGFLSLYPWLAKVSSVKQVFFTDHSSRPAGYVPARAPFWKRTLIRLINYPISRVICVSRYGYECMTTLDVLPRNRFKLIYNGVDLSRIATNHHSASDFRRKYGIPSGKIIVLQVSWIIPEKGIPDLLQAARLVVAQDENVVFLIVGDGPYRAQYMKMAADMGIESNIVWTGLVEDPFGEGAFGVADIVCQLSNWEEVFGWMIAESMAHAKPIVATRVGGIPELVQEGESGFLVERGATASISERVLTLVRDHALRERMGAAGCEIARDKFALQANVSQLMAVYGV